jgi:hypothetical protein
MPMPAVLPPELVFAARLLRKSPGFTLVAAVSLALAIGANTTIFSIAKQLLFERLDIPDAANLRLLASMDANFSYPMYEQLRAEAPPEVLPIVSHLILIQPTVENGVAGARNQRYLQLFATAV